MDQLAQREGWARNQIEAFQLDRLNRLWARAVEHAPHYRDLRRELSLPPQFESLQQFRSLVPVLRKEQVRGHEARFLCDDRERGRGYSTGGSTGRPMRIFWSDRDHQDVMRAKYRFYASHGVDLFEPTVFLWGAAHRFAPGWKGRAQRLRERAIDRLRNRRRLSAYTLEDARLSGYLEEIQRFRPTMLYGFSRAVHLLARAAERRNFRCDSLRLIVLSSEVASPSLIETVEQAFGVPVVMEYGAAECPLIANQTQDGTWRVREDMVIVETLPRDDGRYDVLLTVLANGSCPMLRYAIEDVVDRPLERPETGFAVLAPVAGRNDELLLSGRGEIVHPTAVDAVFEAQPAVRRYRVHQSRDGTILARLELGGPLDEQHRRMLRDQLRAVMARPTRIETVDTLSCTGAGKHRAISSDLTSDACNPSASERSTMRLSSKSQPCASAAATVALDA